MQIEAHAPGPPMGSAVECVGPAAPFGLEATSVGPVAESVGPVAASVGPAAESAGPVAASVGPVAASVGPAEEPAGPVAASMGPVAASVGPAAASVGPVAASVGPAAASVGLVAASVGPAVSGGGTCVVSWNLRREVRRLDKLTLSQGEKLDPGSITAMFLSEVNVVSEKVTEAELSLWAPGSDIFINTVPIGKAKRGLVAVVQHSMGPTLVDSGENEHLQWIVVELAAHLPRPVRIAGVYWPPQRSAAQLESDAPEFRKLFTKYGVDVVVGDMNARAPQWDSGVARADARAEVILQLMEDCGAIIWPSSPATSFLASNGSSCVDLVVASAEFAHETGLKARFGHSQCGSDHLPLEVTWSRGGKSAPRCGRARIARSAIDWVGFAERLAGELANTADLTFSSLRRCFRSAYKALPRGRPSLAEPVAIVDQRIKAVRYQDSAKIWRVLQAMHQGMSPLRVPEGQLLTDQAKAKGKAKESEVWLLTDRAKARALRKHFMSLVSKENPAAVVELERELATCPNVPVPRVTADELAMAAKRMAGAAPGLDGIRPEVFQGRNMLASLACISNRALEGDVPAEWSEIQTAPLAKEGKPPTDPKNYRPIGLTCVCFRLVDRVLVERIEEAGLLTLSTAQYAYTKDTGVEEALLSLHAAILGRANKTVWRRKDQCPAPGVVAVLKIDFKDAFCALSHAEVLRGMLEAGVPKSYIAFWHQVGQRKNVPCAGRGLRLRGVLCALWGEPRGLQCTPEVGILRRLSAAGTAGAKGWGAVGVVPRALQHL